MAVAPLDLPTITTRAGRALAHVDKWGARGVTDLSFEAIEAMALALAAYGMKPLGPDQVWSEGETPAAIPEGGA